MWQIQCGYCEFVRAALRGGMAYTASLVISCFAIGNRQKDRRQRDRESEKKREKARGEREREREERDRER